ncbi:MAG: hypothetical protein WCI67_15945 [Chloroflexales bacterium]
MTTRTPLVIVLGQTRQMPAGDTVAPAHGGTGVDLSAGGGAGYVLKQAAGGVISSAALIASDIPSLAWSKITTGVPTTLAGYGVTDAEPALGNPSVTGYVLSSTTAGVRSWVAPGIAGVLGTTQGGTGVNNAGTLTNASNTTVTGGGTLALAGYTLTVPATGTAVLSTDSRLTDARAPTAHNQDASTITAGQLALARGGTGADLSATGGAGYVLKQATAGATVTVGALTYSDVGAASSGHTHTASAVGAEPALGNPGVTGYVLSSTSEGVRSWVASGGGGILATTLGGTGVNNAGTLTNASNTTITGGGTIALAGYTLTTPATGTAALLGVANAFTLINTFSGINVGTATGATAGQILISGQVGVGGTATRGMLEVSGAKADGGATNTGILVLHDSRTQALGVGGSIAFSSYSDGLTTPVIGASIELYKMYDANTNTAYHLRFYSKRHYFAPALAMTLDNLQNTFLTGGLTVGTAPTTPATAGQISASGAVTIAATATTDTGDTSSTLRLKRTVLQTQGILFQKSYSYDVGIYNKAADDSLCFGSSMNSGTAWVEKMRISPSGGGVTIAESLTANSINVGSATGATAGQIKTNAAIFPGGSNIRIQSYENASVSNGATWTVRAVTANVASWIIIASGLANSAEVIGLMYLIGTSVSSISLSSTYWYAGDTTNRHCLYYSAGNLIYKNTMGYTAAVRIMIIGVG